jgi:hypothetical protein
MSATIQPIRSRWDKRRARLMPQTAGTRDVSSDWSSYGHDDDHGASRQQKRHANGSQCRSANIFAPLPWTDAREQRREWIKKS